MKEDIFRKKSLDRIKSPEDLNDYIRVSNPGIWMLLAAMIVLLLGACVWGIFGHVDSVIRAEARAENGTVNCFFAEEDRERVEAGMKVRIGGISAVVSAVGTEISDGKCSCLVSTETAVPDGEYEAEIVTKRFKPISFIFN